jgi:hypothetical protein
MRFRFIIKHKVIVAGYDFSNIICIENPVRKERSGVKAGKK